jgi:WD40 repeat protein
MKIIRTDRTILSLEFSPDGRFLASGGWNRVELWDMMTGELTKIEQENCLFVTSIAFSKDASQLLWICQTSENDNHLEIRSAAIAKRRQTTSNVLPAFSEDQLVVLAQGIVLTVVMETGVFWEMATLKNRPEREFQNGRGEVSIWHSPFGRTPTHCLGKGQARTSLDPVPKGTLLARTEGKSRFAGGRLVVWPVGGCNAVFSQDQPAVHAIAFTPDGCRMIACEERTVCTWDTSRWQRLEQFDWNIGSPQCVAVSPDGLTAAASGFAGDIIIWDIDA